MTDVLLGVKIGIGIYTGYKIIRLVLDCIDSFFSERLCWWSAADYNESLRKKYQTKGDWIAEQPQGAEGYLQPTPANLRGKYRLAYHWIKLLASR